MRDKERRQTHTMGLTNPYVPACIVFFTRTCIALYKLRDSLTLCTGSEIRMKTTTHNGSEINIWHRHYQSHNSHRLAPLWTCVGLASSAAMSGIHRVLSPSSLFSQVGWRACLPFDTKPVQPLTELQCSPEPSMITCTRMPTQRRREIFGRPTYCLSVTHLLQHK
jgi:hypothetical protein